MTLDKRSCLFSSFSWFWWTRVLDPRIVSSTFVKLILSVFSLPDTKYSQNFSYFVGLLYRLWAVYLSHMDRTAQKIQTFLNFLLPSALDSNHMNVMTKIFVSFSPQPLFVHLKIKQLQTYFSNHPTENMKRDHFSTSRPCLYSCHCHS